MITLREMILVNEFVVLIDLITLTVLLVINIEELKNINRYLTNEKEEKEIEEAMKDYEEEVEIL